MLFVHRVMCSRLFLAFLFILVILLAKGQSVLASGDWYKVGITETGIYKLNREFLSSLGLNVNSLDPRTIKVYGNGGGGMLPQSNAESRTFDLLENIIFSSGEGDGSFDTEDYFLFYGRSPNKIEWSESGLTYEKNLYSDTTYYFITVGGQAGFRISNLPSEKEQVEKITSYDDVIIHEMDKTNLLSSGREWYGEVLSPATGLSESFNFQVADVVSYELAELHAMTQSEGNCSLAMEINNSTVGSIDLSAVPFGFGTTHSIKGSESSDVFALSGSSDNISVDFTFTPNGTTSILYLDWFSVSLTRFLILADSPLYFRSVASLANAISSFEISTTEEALQIWEVTNPSSASSIDYSATAGQAVFSVSTDELKEFVAFAGSDFPKPVGFGEVYNQSIQSSTVIDGIIVTHPNFLEQAQRLADFHESHDNLTVKVVTTREVYNEFSSGMQDISAIRDYAKYVYDTGGRLRYLLLFGDGSYDYHDRLIVNTNYVPIYESRNSLHPIFSHSSDDYFAFFESDEGEWIETSSGDHTMEIGIGRLPVKTPEEAEQVVDKIIRYCTSTATLGKWRNEIVYISDDGDGNVHVRHAEDLSKIIDEGSGFNIKKIYLDAFKQEGNTSKERSPGTTRAILDAIESGAFMVNYMGHGNERLWMDEQVLTISDIGRLTNFQKLPIFATATCEFGRYDDPIQFSGAEQLLLNNSGAIALLTTTRPVFASTNLILNQAYHETILDMASDKKFRLGDMIRQTKNNSLVGPVNRNFALLGDPMMRPTFPQYDIILDQFQAIEPDTLSALERVELTGHIMNEDQLISNFNGKLDMVLFDIPTEKITKGKGEQNSPYLYSEQDNALFRGEATVTDGKFSITFIIPKNISYQNKIGKLSLYAWDNASGRDAGGVSKNLVLGGTDETTAPDTFPPDLQVYLNQPSFKNGQVVGSGALLIAQFSDESGMNISYLGLERGITLNLNGEIIELNDFYSSKIDDFTKGTVLYPLLNLEPGQYTAIIKGADTYNNSVEKAVDFVVSNQPILQTFNFKNYPNPAHLFTNFTFEHDREGEPLVVNVILYAMNGDQVYTVREQIDFSERNVAVRLDFDGRIIEDGLYLYRITVRSHLDGAMDELVGRIIIRN